MTFHDADDAVVPELTMRVEEDNKSETKGNHKLSQYEVEEGEDGLDEPLIKNEGSFFCWKWRWSVIWYWMKLAILLIFVGSLICVVVKWVAPFVMDKELIPIINWETTTFSPPVLGILISVTVAVFPSLLLPSAPSMWVAGMTFGYCYGFLMIISAVAVGVSLPYFIGSLFLRRIQRWLDKYPKKAAILRAAGEGSWSHQLKTVTLIRISPFPYILYNYCSIATGVKYGPYLVGSLLGMVPDIFVAIYTGIFIKTLADASQERHSLTAPQIVLNVLGFCGTVVATIVVTVYAKRKLKALNDDPLLS